MKKRIYTCVLMLFLAYPAFSLSFDALPNYQDEGTKLYVRGTGKLQEQNYTEAISDLIRAVKLRPDIAEAFHNLGFAYERTGDLRNAARAYERALQIKPNYPSALNNLGYLLATSDTEIEKAVALCQRAVELQPNSASFQDSLGWALYKAGRHPEAARHFSAAVKIDPSFFKSHFNLGLVEFANNNYAAAIVHFRNCLQINSGYLKAYVSLADSYEKVNDNARALHIYRQALTRASEGDPIKRHLERKVRTLTEESKKQYFSAVTGRQGSSALQEFMSRKNRTGELGARLNPATSRVAVNSNYTPVSAVSQPSNLFASPMPMPVPVVESANVSTSYSTIQPGFIAAQNAADNDSLSLSYSASSVHLMSTPREISVDQERELERKYSLSKSYLDRGLIREAEKELNTIIRMAPESSMVSRQSRNLLLRVKKEIEDKSSQTALTHRDMGKDFFRSGQYSMAETEFKKALSIDPENAEVCKDLALLYYNQNRYQEAFEQSKKAIALNRTLKEAYVVLASLYARKGRPDDALRTLRMVKEVSTRRDAVDELAEKMMASLTSE